MKRCSFAYRHIFFLGIIIITLNASCRYITVTRIKKEKEKLSASDSTNDPLKKSGLDFSAIGDVPEPWTLQMDLDKKIIFTTSTHGNFLYYPAEITNSIDNKIKTFTSKDSKLKIDIEERPCQAKDIARSTIQTRITCDHINYSGCGIFTQNNVLHNKWILEKIDDASLNTSAVRETPFMQLDLLKMRVNGHDGCNRFFGNFLVEGNRIRFKALGATRMACEKPAAINLSLMSDHLVDYYFKGGKLVLYFINDSKITFRPEF